MTVNRSQGRVDTEEMWNNFSPVTPPPSLSSEMSNLTNNAPQPDETTPLSLDMDSADLTKDSADNVRFADFATKYRKFTLTGIIGFLVFFMCSYMFLLGHQNINNQLQYEDSELLKLLAQQDNILSNVTMGENDLLRQMKLLFDRLDEKEDILSKVTNEKSELADKLAELKGENSWLKDENDYLKGRVTSVETENSSPGAALLRPPTKCATHWWQSGAND
mmetsp:Transcript_27698/g.49901  ORF Transcript_27698/g.49901 Transcript_27698/m.49901 type:complete len:220 (-) Transcript_27698:146-805(-)|eukprot:CAMPEP_0201883544 /NCGR_PEP_ID=MMETSP0902-20130614/15963_1 /ASSEMBLY_ACC=CAM_ASM_000551 /TAXON_ID=420261 /ORGANISM="Thalassiosira antarctica, Strain CCMP982" /LENGTH=219 /DNA_ID=CAMNT_0048412363 /DNA_START=101 /DNA_END=760 /DNA_ORIENTATION=-